MSQSTSTAAQAAMAEGARQAQKAIEDANAAQLKAAQEQLAAAEKMVDVGRELRDYVQGLRIGNLSAIRSLTIPTNTSVAFPWNNNSAADADANGTWVLVLHYSSSSHRLDIFPASGVTIRWNDTGSTSGTITFGGSPDRYSSAGDTRIKLTLLVKAATDTWYLYPLIT